MIFKAYDIRGIYPEQLNEEIAYKIGQAFVNYVGQNIVIGEDNRLSSKPLFESLKKGIIDQGGNIIHIGEVTSPMLYFAANLFNSDGGIMITASHNPSNYNGFKMVTKKAFPLSESNGLKEIEKLVLNNHFDQKKKGTIVSKDITDQYVNSFDKIQGNLKIVVDTANSSSGIIVPHLLNNFNLIHIFKDLDPSFPNHEPNPLKEENMVSLKEKVLEAKADLGIAFDGDGDRVSFVDEKGNIVSSDLILALVSSLILKNNPQQKILYDIRCSSIVKETIEGLSGKAILSRVGHSFIKELMREEDVLFGGEYSGHYYLKQGDSYFESPYFVIFEILKALESKKMSELITPFKKYFHSGEINFEVEDKEGIIKRIENKFKEGKINRLDGLRIDFDDWWFLLRASNTEPVLRLIVESNSLEKLESKIKEIKSIILPQ